MFGASPVACRYGNKTGAVAAAAGAEARLGPEWGRGGGLADCCLSNGNSGAPPSCPGHGRPTGTHRVAPVWSSAPGFLLCPWSPFPLDFFASTSLTSVFDSQSSSNRTLSDSQVFLRMRENGETGASQGTSTLIKSTSCQSSELHALWASSGHYSKLVPATPLASFAAS